MRYMTMLQHKDLSLTISMISLGPGIMKLNLVVYLASYSWPEVINIMLMCDMKTNSRQSQGVSLEKFMSAQHRNQTEDVKENKLKGLIIVDIEMFAVKSCKSPFYSRWNDWQSIVIETEYGYAWMDKGRRTTPCAKRRKVSARRKIRSWCRSTSTYATEDDDIVGFSFWHQTEAISCNQTKSGDDAAEKFVSSDAKKATTEATQLLKNVSEQSSKSSLIYMRKKVHQVKKELFHELSEENGKDNDELRNFAAKFYRQDAAMQLQQSTRFLETAQLESRAAVETKNAEEKSFLEENHKWVNFMALRELYFIGATVACGQLQQSSAYPIMKILM